EVSEIDSPLATAGCAVEGTQRGGASGGIGNYRRINVTTIGLPGAGKRVEGGRWRDAGPIKVDITVCGDVVESDVEAGISVTFGVGGGTANAIEKDAKVCAIGGDVANIGVEVATSPPIAQTFASF